MPTWTDSQIDRWQKDAEEDIISRVYTRWTSFSLDITSGTGTYTFNERIYRPTAVLWKGKHIYPYIGREIHAQVPTFRTEQGEPTHYQMSNDGISTIRLIPVPNESLTAGTDLYNQTDIETSFIIRAFVFPDRSADYFQLPDYLYRNLVKCFVLYRAFNAEGIGQNLTASQFWYTRYINLVDLLSVSNSEQYQTKERLDLLGLNRTQKKRLPRLAPDFTIRKIHSDVAVSADTLNEWLDSAEINLGVDPSVLQVSAESDLNNWLDEIDQAFTFAALGVSSADDLNNWNDAVATGELGSMTITAGDDLNNWSDAASVNNAPAITQPDSTWLFDEGSGTTAADSTGSLDGTITGSGAWITGGYDTASDTVVSIGNNYDAGTGSTPFSISIVFFLDNAFAAAAEILGKGAAANGPGFQVWTNYGTTTTFGFDLINSYAASGPYLRVRSPSSSIASNTWLHITVTYDGSGAASGVTLYKNGSSVTPTTVRDLFATTATNTGNYVMGNSSIANSCIVGGFGIIRHWAGTELSASDVSSWYTTDQSIMSGRGVTI